MWRACGIAPALLLVLRAGGRAAKAAEPSASAFLVADTRAGRALMAAAEASDIVAALRAPPLHRGASADLLRALLGGVLIRSTILLDPLDRVRRGLTLAVFCGEAPRLPVPVASLLAAIAEQARMQDGTFLCPPDDVLVRALGSADALDPAHADVLRLFGDPGMCETTVGPPWPRSGRPS